VIHTPTLDWLTLAPVLSLTGAATLTLLAAVLRTRAPTQARELGAMSAWLTAGALASAVVLYERSGLPAAPSPVRSSAIAMALWPPSSSPAPDFSPHSRSTASAPATDRFAERFALTRLGWRRDDLLCPSGLIC